MFTTGLNIMRSRLTVPYNPIDKLDITGNSAFLRAIISNDIENVKTIYLKNPDITLRNHNTGCGAFDYAVKNNNKAIVEFLIEKLEKKNIVLTEDTVKTALNVALRYYQNDMIILLQNILSTLKGNKQHFQTYSPFPSNNQNIANVIKGSLPAIILQKMDASEEIELKNLKAWPPSRLNYFKMEQCNSASRTAYAQNNVNKFKNSSFFSAKT